MTNNIDIILRNLSKTRLKQLKKDYEEQLMYQEIGSDRAKYSVKVIDAIEEKLGDN